MTMLMMDMVPGFSHFSGTVAHLFIFYLVEPTKEIVRLCATVVLYRFHFHLGRIGNGLHSVFSSENWTPCVMAASTAKKNAGTGR